MKQFRNILVGVDLASDAELCPASRAAVRQALILAGSSGAEVTVLHAVDVPTQMQGLLSVQPQSLLTKKTQALHAQVQQLQSSLKAAAVQTGIHVCCGKPWRELMQAAEQGGHDLLLLGAEPHSPLHRALFGSVSNRLLRYCPCPVWVVRAGEVSGLQNILVAHELGSAGDQALQLAAGLSETSGAGLHVLHVLELPEDDSFLATVSRDSIEQRLSEARRQLAERCAALSLSAPVSIHVRQGTAYSGILDFLEHHNVDLLCMGTVARSHLAGIITGNTAEKVLPWLSSSLLAVKPEGFNSGLSSGKAGAGDKTVTTANVRAL